MEEENDRILSPHEIEVYLENLQPHLIPDIGSTRWLHQRERLYNLSLQASLEVRYGREEIVKELLVTLEKTPLLIHELIATELWRIKIFTFLLDMEIESKSTIPVYIVLYHEVTLLSLLEAVLFHDEVVESAGDSLIDLVDYCYRNTLPITSDQSEDDSKNSQEIISDEKERLIEQKNEIGFECAIKCISLLSYMAQHIKILPLSVIHRLLVVHDIPLLFTKFIENPPWERDEKGEKKTYFDGKWNTVSAKDTFKINKVEGQVWITLIQLLLNPDCQKKYDMSGYKKDQLLKLRSRLNDVIFDQIPILRELLRFLEHLSLFDAPVPKTGVVIEQIAEIWECLQKEYENNWHGIARKQLAEYFSPSENELQKLCKDFQNSDKMPAEQLQFLGVVLQNTEYNSVPGPGCISLLSLKAFLTLTSSFDLKSIEAMLPDVPACAHCGEQGLKRCSRCKNEWYCGRQCQVSHWSRHQSACNLIAK